MKKTLLIPLLLLLFYTGHAQVGIGTTDPKGVLDIDSANDGLLIPRVALQSTASLAINSSGATIATPTASELVYNTNTNMDVTPGYYYLSAPAGPWVRLGTGSGGGTTPTPAWERSGNTGIDPSTNFLGTTDSNPLIIKTSGTEQMRVLPDGKIGIGTNMPNEKLSVNGNASVSGTVETNGGFKLYNPPAGSNLKRADIVMNTNSVDFRMLNDNSSVGSVYMSAIRAGGNVSSVVFPNSGVGIGTVMPAAKLDITSTNEGILIPRVSLQSTTSLSPLTPVTATASELVYNTNTSPVGSANPVTPGYYYLSTATGPWVRLVTGGDAEQDWAITGNLGTNPTDNFLGTRDNQGLAIKTNNADRIRVTATGEVGIGNTVPGARLDVEAANGDGLLVRQETGVPNQTSLQTYIDGHRTDIATYVGDANYSLSLQPVKGRVGIGTTAPSAKLSVFAGTIGTAVNTEMDLANFGGLSGSSARLGLSLFKTGAANNWQNTALLLGYDVDATKRAGGYISMLNGNVGISTAIPGYKLSIMSALPMYSAGMRPLGGLGLFDTALPLSAQLGWVRKPNQDPVVLMQGVQEGVAWRDISIARDGGNVGIGTDSPAQKLHVIGNTTSSGTITSGANVMAGGNIHNTGGFVYPGQQNGATTGAYQGSWYLGSHSSYGLWTNTGFYATGSITTPIYLYAQYLNTTQITEPTISSYTVKSFPIRTSDDFIRMFSAADMRTALGLGTKPTFSGVGATQIALGSTSNSTAALELTAPASSTVHISFHRPGQFATNFGLDPDGAFSFGGWSHGNAFAPIKTGTITASGYVYPGRVDAPGANQTGWYLGSHGSYGLYTNTGLYATSGVYTAEWFRNTVAGLGLYNNALGNHFAAVTDADWRITGDGGSCGLGFGSSNFSTVYGYAYGDAAGIGFLTPGRAWAIRWLNNNTEITGNVLITGTMNSTGYRETSDRRWKKDIIPIANPLAKIMALKGVGYNFKTKQELGSQQLDSTYNFTATPQIGFIAQDVESVLPEVVGTDVKGYKTVEYAKVVAVLTEAMKEQQKQIEEQQKQIEELKKQNLVLKASGDKVDAMEARLGQLEQLLGKANGNRASNEQ